MLRSIQNFLSEEDLFLRMFRVEYGDTEKYFKTIGLNDMEIILIREKLCNNSL